MFEKTERLDDAAIAGAELSADMLVPLRSRTCALARRNLEADPCDDIGYETGLASSDAGLGGVEPPPQKVAALVREPFGVRILRGEP